MNETWPPEGTVPLLADVVSVQSQVVYGRVGNKVAVPTLEAFGLTVAEVPTVILSNTPHYPSLHGGALPLDWFSGYLDDLVARGALAKLQAVTTGYLGNAGQAAALVDWIEKLQASRRQLRVVTDPVIGDHDKGVYVDPGLVDAYRHKLMSLATGLTPNDFELAHLSGQRAATPEQVVRTARQLLVGRTEWLAATSAAPASWASGSMHVVLVTREQAWLLTHPFIDIAPKGTGDLFSASLTAHWLAGEALPQAATRACGRVMQALRLTQRARCAELLLPDGRSGDSADDVLVREIKVTASKE